MTDERKIIRREILEKFIPAELNDWENLQEHLYLGKPRIKGLSIYQPPVLTQAELIELLRQRCEWQRKFQATHNKE